MARALFERPTHYRVTRKPLGPYPIGSVMPASALPAHKLAQLSEQRLLEPVPPDEVEASKKAARRGRRSE